MSRKTLYVSNDNKRIKGTITGITKIYRTLNGFVIEFADPDYAFEASKVFYQSGYIVRMI